MGLKGNDWSFVEDCPCGRQIRGIVDRQQRELVRFWCIKCDHVWLSQYGEKGDR